MYQSEAENNFKANVNINKQAGIAGRFLMNFSRRCLQRFDINKTYF